MSGLNRWGDHSFLFDGVGDGLASGVTLNSGRGVTVLSLLNSSDLDNSGVDSAANTVLHLDVKLGDDVGLESLVFLQVLLG